MSDIHIYSGVFCGICYMENEASIRYTGEGIIRKERLFEKGLTNKRIKCIMATEHSFY